MSQEMSNNAEAPVRSPSEITQQIVATVLEDDSLVGVPVVTEFRTAHSALQDRIAQSQDRTKRLLDAKTECTQHEGKVKEKLDQQKAAESRLNYLHRPLGEAIVNGMLSGSLEQQAAFSDRMAAHQRICDLKQESDDLDAKAVGLLGKAKAKAQQLVILGKLKLEEGKIPKLDEAIGKQIIESIGEDTVQCSETDSVLERLKTVRAEIQHCAGEVEEAEKALAAKIRERAESLGLESTESSTAFDAEMGACSQEADECEREIAQLVSKLADSLLEATEIPASTQLNGLVEELRTVKASIPQVEAASTGTGLSILGRPVKSLRFTYGGAGGGKFCDEFGEPVIWAGEDSWTSNTISAYVDQEKTKLLFKITSPGLGSRLWQELQVTDALDQPIGTIKWQGGPVVSKWLMRDSQGRELLSEERMSKERYAAKLAGRAIPGAITTGTLTLIAGGSDVGAVVKKKGTGSDVGAAGKWYGSIRAAFYEIENIRAISSYVDIRLLIAAMALESIYAEK